MFSIIGFLVFMYALACVSSALNLTSFNFSKEIMGYEVDLTSDQEEPVCISVSKK